MGDSRNGVAGGWPVYVRATAEPQGDYEPRRHGNWKHGRFAKDDGSRALLRLCIRLLRRGINRVPDGVDWPGARQPIGWRIFPHVRVGPLSVSTLRSTRDD